MRLNIILVWHIFFSSLIAFSQPIPSIDASLERQTRLDELQVSGEWLFFPNKFIDPNNTETWADRVLNAIPVNVPSDISQYSQDKIGYGSYLVELKNFRRINEDLAIKLRVDTAFKVYLIDKYRPEQVQEVLSVGKVGKAADTSIPQISDALGRFRVGKVSDYYLVIHFSNFHWKSSGIWSAPVIGNYDVLNRSLNIQRSNDFMVLGMLVIMGFYNFSLFLFRKEDIKSLLLAGHCLFITLRSFSVSALPLLWFPEASLVTYEILRKFELGLTNHTAYFLLTFVLISFKESYSKSKIQTYWSYFVHLVLLFALTTPAELYSRYILLFQLPILIMAIPGMKILIEASLKGKVGARMSMFGVVAVIVTASYDIAIGLGLINSTIFLSAYGIAILNFTQSEVIAVMFSKAFRTAELLTKQLSHEVEMQTREIRSMLDNIPQGIFTVVQGGIIDANYSAHLKKIYGSKLDIEKK